MRMPFGRLHGKNPEIIALAKKIGRTPGALAMKACNFASLDPTFLATDRAGLSGASAADRVLWEEFSENTEAVAEEAEAVSEQFEPMEAADAKAASRPPTGETETVRQVRTRRVQSFFRAAVLTSYDNRCAVSGLEVPDLLIASHILPWSQSVERRADPSNGLCLSALLDRAFDKGLMTIDEQLRVVMSEELLTKAKAAKLSCSIPKANGQAIRLPNRFRPDEHALAQHRRYLFVDSDEYRGKLP
jgi:hypothetical protein